MKLTLKIITQEKKLLEVEADNVTVPTVEGQITVLPKHIPLFTKVQTGELVYRHNGQETSVVLADGFIDVGPDDTVTVMVDTAIRSDDIDLLKAEEARKRAEEAMANKEDAREYAMAEANLRRAMAEIQAFHKKLKK
jgi:F-type H+-transporting ATPase subunit epsilon